MTEGSSNRQATSFIGAIGPLLAVLVLYLASDLLIPLTFALLLSFIFGPIASRVCRLGIPNVIATSIVLGVASTLALGALALTSSQALDLATKLPEYRQTLVNRIRLVKSTSSGSFSELASTVSTLNQELARPTPTTGPAGAIPIESLAAAVPVTVIAKDTSMLTMAGEWITPLISPLASVSVVLLLTFFIVLEREPLTRKLRRVSRSRDLVDAAEGAEEAIALVGRYLLMQLIINTTYGLCLALIMASLGLPNALMWGLLGGLLRYVPYVGPVVAIAMPTALALAIAPGWGKPIMTLGFLLVLEAVTNLILEPLLYGNTTGVSSFGVVLSAVFWGWLWGPAGLLLGMPLTVCVVIIGKHIRPLQVLSELLSADIPETAQPQRTPDAIPA